MHVICAIFDASEAGKTSSVRSCAEAPIREVRPTQVLYHCRGDTLVPVFLLG